MSSAPSVRVPETLRAAIDLKLLEGHRPSDVAAVFSVPTRYAIERLEALRRKEKRRAAREGRRAAITVSPEVSAEIERWKAAQAA